MAFLNMKKVVFQNDYTMEELYDAIKDVDFPAGRPMLAKHGANTLVVFAPLNKDMQLVINPGKFGNKINTYRVMILPEVGLANLIKSEIIDELTDDWALVLNVIGNDAKKYRKFVDTVAQQLLELGL